MNTPSEDGASATPTYRAEMAFYEIRDGRRVNEMTVDVRGSSNVVTRMAEAAAGAFEEETTR
ncbi:hypothetical protein [Streptomyces boncukensis]|uniref:Uncharacterized protein n=1 Tax=Streptomyces boncukensis TaxID=2711219 RepID=A0A6G4WQ80_9ACTN|nr:hypothetical protein [Streptomyces boncukensis]NGO66787.1 hypothetical protein [Streptomyces boncukensis]